MKRLVVLGAAALAASACANTVAESSIRAQQALIGMPKAALLSCAGVPERQAVVDNQEFFTYTSSRIETRSGMSWPGHPYGWNMPTTEVRSERCEATFTIKDGVVQRVVYGGDGTQGVYGQCYAIIRNCVPPPPLR